MALVGLGFRNLSMAPSSIGPVKAMIRSLEVAPLEGLIAELGHVPSRGWRGRMRNFAHDHGVLV